MAIAFNMFAMTFFLIALSVTGHPEMAADVGVIQGALLAAFMAFSANARNLILASKTDIEIKEQFGFRVVLLLPLAVVVFFLSNTMVESTIVVTVMLILRRCAEWMAELHISEREKYGDMPYAFRFILFQFVSLTLLIASPLINGGQDFILALGIWAATPILQSMPFFIRMVKSSSLPSMRSFLPHLGSSWAIAISTYIFRVLIILMAGRVVGGMLISAYAIGGMLNAVYTYAIGPSQALKAKSSSNAVPDALRLTVIILLAVGFCVIISAFTLDWIDETKLFIQTIGFSFMGGGLMILAQHHRIHMLQILKISAFVPDVLSNVLLIATIPFIYFLLGVESLSALFFWSGILAYVFYALSPAITHWTDRNQDRENGYKLTRLHHHSRQAWLLFLMFIPVFFQLSGRIFNSPVMLFDAKGMLFDLPLPIAAIVCFVAIALLVNFDRVRLSVSVLFVVFTCMLLTSVIAFNLADVEQNVGKFILLMQYILPLFALVLGQSYVQPENSSYRFEAIFLYILAVVVPLQLLATLLQGHNILTPYLYVISIYQHLDYVPVIFVSGYLLALYSEFDEPSLRKVLLWLSPFMGVYVIYSDSLGAITLLFVGGTLAPFVLSKLNTSKLAIGFVFVSLLVAFIARPDSNLQGVTASIEQAGINNETEMDGRLKHWELYTKGITEDFPTFLFGHSQQPDQLEVRSAYNYYLGLIYNFGFMALIPLGSLIIFTVIKLYNKRKDPALSSSSLALAGLVLFFLLIENSFNVSLRQPYPGIIIFFIWGVLLSRLSEAGNGNLKLSKKMDVQ
ncbi:hypothetical protein MMIC_P0706 [Mariprofundus micogutta]|uniref:Uncharacterized protein n=2 Tax=Mariprofundus micogutta TaxID=1921010 RepID=A0A1L8CLM9_9PROT|nr:hypothetical protein MMIC_P0706 [Mariprofundus micogutta]